MTHLITQTALDGLRKGFTGQIIVPGDPAYSEARRVFNAMIDRRPGVIAQCANVKDVVRAVHFGRNLNIEIAVRGGGHSVAGKALTDGGLVIDLRRMNAVSVDSKARTALVAGGATMSRLDRATQPHGLATTGGRVSTTGVGGFTLGGGGGWLDRKFGLACDNLLSVDLVTADGAIVRASGDENPELFWALHGGGGNFGVAISFTFRLHALPLVTAAHVLFPQGGAVARGPADYPVPWRRAPWIVHPFGLWQNPSDDERGMEWVRALRADLKRWSSGTVYLNFIGEEGEDRVVAGFGQENYARLAIVKAQYDPENVFHVNHNIKPA